MDKNELTNYMDSIKAAEYLGVTPTRVNAIRRSGKIGTKIGSFWLYSKDELDHYKATRKTGRPRKKGAGHDQTPDHRQDAERGNTTNDETKGENSSEA